jgi:23S rRNA pseudouridine1911/1915/1917 synthase
MEGQALTGAQRLAMIDLPILFEDNHLLVVDKPAGLLAQADLSGDLDVLTLAREIVGRRDRKPGNVYLGLVHRLDRPVSGVMLLAKTSKAAARLSAQLRDRRTDKRYLAVVSGVPEPPAAELRHTLRRDRGARVTRVVTAGGKPALLRYRVVGRRPTRSLLEVELVTGLPHQIRAQLAAIGHPVVGDRKYGSRARFPAGRIALHARSIGFEHPVRHELLLIVADPPQHWPW